MEFLGENEVHVWKAELDHPALLNRHEELLDPLEKERARRYRFMKDRLHFSTCRAILRLLLGRYFNQNPRSLDFIYNPHGKPSLKEGGGKLHFNLAHSGSLALYAFSRISPLGIDVEKIDPARKWPAMAKKYFNSGERDYLEHRPEGKKAEAFFSLWTMKEAIVKATGRGVAQTLSMVDTFGMDPSWWRLTSLHPKDGFIGALAIGGPPIVLKEFEWDSSASHNFDV